MRKQSPLFKAIITVILLLLLLAALWLGARLLRGEVSRRQAPAAANAANAADSADSADATRGGARETADALLKYPFLLKITHSALSGVDYTSFEVYDTGGGGEELVFVCGRQYAADTVAGIAWDADESGYDITVTLRDGTQINHCFDGSNTSWQ